MSDGANRAILIIIALVLIAAGVVGLLAAATVIAVEQPSVLYERLAASVQAAPRLWWPGLGLVALGILILALVWALRQLIVRRTGTALSTVTLQSGGRGRTTVDAAAVAAAAAADLQQLPQVTATTARLVSDGGERVLRTRLDVLADADLAAVRTAADEVYDRVANVLGTGRLDTHTRLNPVGGEAPRVQ